MFILEEPYVSDLLAATVVELGLPVLRTPIAERRLPAPHAALLRDDAAFSAAARTAGRAALLQLRERDRLDRRAPRRAPTCRGRSQLFKDKVAFRDLVADLYPDYRYAGVPAGELRAFDPARLRAPFIVKPAVGFFSLGVHVVESATAWPAVVAEIESEVQALGHLYPEQVLDLGHFVVEEVIEGEEFAVDAYYDADGAPVLVNAYAHLFSSADDVSDRVYLTSAETVARLGPPAVEFLTEIGRRARLADFPVHTELRVDGAGRVAPIEVNPMRFGGWCATDLAHFAYGVNPYRCYLRDERPDWGRIAEQTAGRTTALIVADLPASVDLAAIASVDYEGFAARFSRVLELRPTDVNRYPVFAFTFVDVPSGDLSELHAVLGADLREHLQAGQPSRLIRLRRAATRWRTEVAGRRASRFSGGSRRWTTACSRPARVSRSSCTCTATERCARIQSLSACSDEAWSSTAACTTSPSWSRRTAASARRTAELRTLPARCVRPTRSPSVSALARPEGHFVAPACPT